MCLSITPVRPAQTSDVVRRVTGPSYSHVANVVVRVRLKRVSLCASYGDCAVSIVRLRYDGQRVIFKYFITMYFIIYDNILLIPTLGCLGQIKTITSLYFHGYDIFDVPEFDKKNSTSSIFMEILK